MEFQTFQFDYDDLGLTPDMIEEVMGYQPGHAPEPIPDLIGEVLGQVSHLCAIQGGYVIRDKILLDNDNKVLQVDSVQFHIRKIISRQIRSAEKIAIFVCTAGPDITEWSKSLMNQGDLLKGYAVDVAGSEIVELAMDRIQDLLEKDMGRMGLGITDRFSPGYCDWQVSEQQKLFSFFPADFCGITLSDSSLMYPIKSVSGIIGIGTKSRRKGYVCNYCDMVNCIYRQKRTGKSAGAC